MTSINTNMIAKLCFGCAYMGFERDYSTNLTWKARSSVLKELLGGGAVPVTTENGRAFASPNVQMIKGIATTESEPSLLFRVGTAVGT